ncbi:MAG: VanZ family protein [Dysgonamonadaceae bacterium]|nr:VanZ family protein [Dysgonamonadaceae bacterium]
MIRFLKKYWISISVNVAVLTVCMIKPPEVEGLPVTNFDKLIHLLLFMGISGITFFDNTSYLRKKISLLRIFLGSFIFPLVFGGLIEVLQATLTSSRSGDWTDVGFDAIGAIIGMMTCVLINVRIKS